MDDYYYSCASTSPTFRSKGVVILMFSRLPSTVFTFTPRLSTTEASSVKASRSGWLKACLASEMSNLGCLHGAEQLSVDGVAVARSVVDVAQRVGDRYDRHGGVFLVSHIEAAADDLL